jgi:hypothetical protein
MSRFLTMSEASEHCRGRPSVATMHRLARDGHLPVRRVGLDAYVAKLRAGGEQ